MGILIFYLKGFESNFLDDLMCFKHLYNKKRDHNKADNKGHIIGKTKCNEKEKKIYKKKFHARFRGNNIDLFFVFGFLFKPKDKSGQDGTHRSCARISLAS